jgi:hypothetical protein
MQHTFGAAWELSSVPPAPLDLRATDATGQTVVARWAAGHMLKCVIS